MARKRTADKQHRWLSQVEVTGVVFSEPVLAEAAPAGFPNLDKKVLAQFYKAREIWNLPKGMFRDDGQGAWIQFVFNEILRLRKADDWLLGATIPAALVVNLSEQQETLRPNRVLLDEGAPVMVFLEVPRSQSLDRPWLQKTGRWKASPTTKLERLLRETRVELGLVTNGEGWRLLVASPSETASWITWTANTWADSPITLAAFRDLLGEERFFAGERENVVMELIRRSRERQLDVADQLGAQVREALGLLVHELDRVDAALAGRLLKDYSESEIFEAVVAFIMRLLFLLFAEENGLLPHGTVAYDNAYGILHLLTELENQHRLAPEKLKHSYAAYARILATTRLIHAGSVDPDIRIAAHGGRLFDPDCYHLLEGRCKGGAWPVDPPEPPRISDGVVRNVLRSLKYARANGANQLVSYRTLAVEQIGHMYEGLLDRRVARAPSDSALFLLQGSSKVAEPKPVYAAEVEELEASDLLKLLTKRTGRTRKTLRDLLERPENRVRLPDPGTDDAELLSGLAPVRRFVVDRGAVRPGGLYVAPGKDRRSQGAHYTPPILTEPIVRRTLEHQVYINVPDKPGLLIEPRRVKTPEVLLDLKVCDPAMGSGAFLVQVVRYLAERLVDSWELRALEQPNVVLTMPFAKPSEGLDGEALLPESREDRLLWGKRYVAEHCVYGVDVNRHAVEMAKLSLWIATASKDRPFTFLDHALKHGDSLVGLTKEQIQAFTWKELGLGWGPLFEGIIQSVEEAREYRGLLHELPDHDYCGKAEQLGKADGTLSQARLIGDMTIAAFLCEEKDNAREARRREFQLKVTDWKAGCSNSGQFTDIVEQLRGGRQPTIPFHWEIEFPEVFERESSGFDAMVGNPPFLGGRKLCTTFGDRYAEIIRKLILRRKGSVNLVGYFVIQGMEKMREGAQFGVVATSSLVEGENRAAVLRPLIMGGHSIAWARTKAPWPGEASVHIVQMSIRKGSVAPSPLLDEEPVSHINSRLRARPEPSDPLRLIANRHLHSDGVKVQGIGFVIGNEEADALRERSGHNSEVVWPYVTGDDLNSLPHANGSRWVINFSDMTEAQASQFREPFGIVYERVKPYRDGLTRQIHESCFWRFWDRREEFFGRCSRLSRVIVMSKLSKYRAPTFGSVRNIYSEKVKVFASDDAAILGILLSQAHDAWSLQEGSTTGATPAYSGTKCFDTFPLPESNAFGPIRKIATECYEHRCRLQAEKDIGLTVTYNRFHDQDDQDQRIICLRKLHTALDQTVIGAYGWSDISTDCEFVTDGETGQPAKQGKESWRYRWPDDIREEVISRLLELNQNRYQEEERRGLHKKRKR